MKALKAIIVLVMVATLAGASAEKSSTPPRIQIESKRFAYDPSEITVKRNQPVTLVLHTDDVTHGLTIKELGIKAEVKKDKPTEVTFTPETDGTFTAKCSHFCGIGHGSMTLKVHVVE